MRVLRLVAGGLLAGAAVGLLGALVRPRRRSFAAGYDPGLQLVEHPTTP